MALQFLHSVVSPISSIARITFTSRSSSIFFSSHGSMRIFNNHCLPSVSMYLPLWGQYCSFRHFHIFLSLFLLLILLKSFIQFLFHWHIFLLYLYFSFNLCVLFGKLVVFVWTLLVSALELVFLCSLLEIPFNCRLMCHSPCKIYM